MAFELVSTHVATTSHWTALATLCAVLTKAKYPTGLSSHVHAQTRITPKTHPPTVVSFAGLLLTNEDREVLRSLKVVIPDFDLLFHAAKAQLSSLAHV